MPRLITSFFALMLLLFLCSNKAIAQNNIPSLDSIKMVAPGAKLKLVSNQFVFAEGPAVDKQGNIYFTDQPNDKIWKYDINGNLSLFMEKTGRSNGLGGYPIHAKKLKLLLHSVSSLYMKILLWKMILNYQKHQKI